MISHQSPLVTVGMAVYNCEKTVGFAIRSILRQSYTEWELIVIDDGSTDRTLEIISNINDSRVRVIEGRAQRGISARLNQPISLARGEYFARMDGDDVAYPERLERQVRYLETHPGIDLLGAGILVFKGNGIAVGTRSIWQTHGEICCRPLSGFYLPHSTWIAKTDWFRKHPYREEARVGDLDLLLNTYETSCFASLPEILVGYREDAVSLRKALMGRRYLINRLARRSIVGGKGRLIACMEIAEHALKALVESFAASTGLDYFILSHRALPIDAQRLSRWEQVWQSLANSEQQVSIVACNDPARI